MRKVKDLVATPEFFKQNISNPNAGSPWTSNFLTSCGPSCPPIVVLQGFESTMVHDIDRDQKHEVRNYLKNSQLRFLFLLIFFFSKYKNHKFVDHKWCIKMCREKRNFVRFSKQRPARKVNNNNN